MNTTPGIRKNEVRKWLDIHVNGVEGELEYHQIIGGHSNLTYTVMEESGRKWVLRRPPLGHVLATAHEDEAAENAYPNQQYSYRIATWADGRVHRRAHVHEPQPVGARGTWKEGEGVDWRSGGTLAVEESVCCRSDLPPGIDGEIMQVGRWR